MGQRSATVMLLYAGGLLVPVALIMAFAPLLGRAAIPVAVGVFAAGVGVLVVAQRRASRLSLSEPLGQPRLSVRNRSALFWFGVALIGCAACIALAAYPYR
jgi:FtsH-binding integral membrane protein